MTRFTKTVLTIASLGAALISSTAAHAGDTFTASFTYHKTASAASNLESFKAAAAAVCAAQLKEAGFRKTDSTNYHRRKCERQLLKTAVKSTNDEVLMSLYMADKNGKARVQLAMNAK